MNLSRHLTVILLVACLGQACSVQPSVERPAGRVIILGFDGVDPSLVDKMLAAGKLPNLAVLREQGSYRRLQTTTPPQSPTAWTTFATCLSPGNHGVYDYLARDPRMYQPIPGVCYSLPPVFFPDGGLRSPAKAFAIRKGTPFWQVADSQGARCKVLHVPFAFPPDALQHSLMLCGAGVPEVGGLTTHFCAFSTSFTAEQLAEDLGGGERIPLELHEGKASVNVPGAPEGLDPQHRSRGSVPLGISVDLANRRLTLEFQGRQVTLTEGQWSPWLEWSLPLTDQYAIRAIGMFYVLEVGPEVRFYLSSLQIHPEEPFLNFSTPETYAPELAKRYGLYKTLGWAHDTTALRRDALNEDAFLEEARVQDAWLERLTLDELDAGKGDLLIAVWTSPDRISHVFWRFTDPQHPLYSAEGAAKHGGAIEESYARVDRITGEVAARLHPEDLLLVLSDHGFHSFRKSFNANTWLLENGYLVLREGVAPGAGNELLRNVDWGRTRAYALGLGAIYLNLQGREGQGQVRPDEAAALLEELRQRLRQTTDPDTGAAVFTEVYTREVFPGEAAAKAPDLQLAYAEGYQTGKESAKGGIPADVLAPNLDKWSGEHAASEAASSPGILFSNRPLPEAPHIIDLGVTALGFLGLKPPPAFEGRNLLAR